jgi:heptosyltransferase II
MRILIELPTWIGDTVMTTPALENIVSYFNSPEIIIIGSKEAVEVMQNHPCVKGKHYIKKNFVNLIKISNFFGYFDIFFSFRSSFRSTIFKFLVNSGSKYQYKKVRYKNRHQVEKYNDFIQDSLKTSFKAKNLILYPANDLHINYSNPTLGIHPGASYGDSKRWYPEEFAKTLFKLSNNYDIIIFGSLKEEVIANDIENLLVSMGVNNIQNLAGQTSIERLIEQISKLDLFITGDSGPMHIAASFQIPTISIFGSTNHLETSQWRNDNSVLVRKNLDCQPCMKRSCPLNHHNCMKSIKANDVLKEVQNLRQANIANI